MGDFNCRFHFRHPKEEDTLGPFVYGRGKEIMEKTLERDEEGTTNRALTLEWAMENDLVCSNTIFQKTPEKLVTYREKTTDLEDKDWNEKEKYAQIDFLWVPQRWKNSIINIESDTRSNFPSDHYPITATVRLKMEQREDYDPGPNVKWKGVQKPYHNQELV